MNDAEVAYNELKSLLDFLKVFAEAKSPLFHEVEIALQGNTLLTPYEHLVYSWCMILKKMKVALWKFTCRCERCGGEWESIGKEPPTRCGKCKSPYWNKPRSTR